MEMSVAGACPKPDSVCHNLPVIADSVGDKEDSIVAAGVVGEANEEIVMEIFDFLLGLGA